MPGPVVGEGDKRNLEWVHIDDFSPGCYDGSHISTEDPVVSAPVGAASLKGTWQCASIPGGALAPLPAMTETTTYTVPFPGAVTTLYEVGFIVNPGLDMNGYEIISILEGDDGTNHYVIAASYVPSIASYNEIAGPTETEPTTPGFFGAPYPAFTRMAPSLPNPVPPVLVFPTAVATDLNNVAGHLWVYPSISAPSSFQADDLNSGFPSVSGQLICYGSRVLALAGIDYPWPAGGGINTNENINFTDPPETNNFGSQQTVLGSETPWGYGAWGSVSVGELLLIKKYGGAVILNGDIDAPTSVISIPGVESTGDFVGSAGLTPSGLYYCSQNRGAWVWNGGNTSQKISANIADNFYDCQTDVIESNNYGFFAYHWQKWVMFSKNVIYDPTTGGWWKIFPQTGQGSNGLDLFWWTLTNNGNQILGAPLALSGVDPIWYLTFDNTVPASNYQWQSLPIHVTPNADRLVSVRQIVVRASDPTNTGTATIELDINGVWTETSDAADNPIGLDPTPLRFNVGVSGDNIADVILTLTANNPTSEGSAPIIHSIDIGYAVREGVAVAD